LAVDDTIYESKNSQLPSLRQNLAKKPLERKKFGKPEDRQVPSVWQHEKLERRIRHTPTGVIQRYYWRDCGLRFSER
jgi:hypothetical protein